MATHLDLSPITNRQRFLSPWDPGELSAPCQSKQYWRKGTKGLFQSKSASNIHLNNLYCNAVCRFENLSHAAERGILAPHKFMAEAKFEPGIFQLCILSHCVTQALWQRLLCRKKKDLKPLMCEASFLTIPSLTRENNGNFLRVPSAVSFHPTPFWVFWSELWIVKVLPASHLEPLQEPKCCLLTRWWEQLHSRGQTSLESHQRVAKHQHLFLFASLLLMPCQEELINCVSFITVSEH